MKYITVLLFCALGFASSCSNMLDQYSHSAIPPEAVTEKDLPALRLGMYNRVQNEPQTRSFWAATSPNPTTIRSTSSIRRSAR